MDAIDKINIKLAERGMSGADLERAIGVSNSVYSQWNTKTTKPSSKSLKKVAAALECSVAEILPDETPKRAKKEPAPLSGDGSSAAHDELIQLLPSLTPQEVAVLLASAKAQVENRKSEDSRR